MDLSGVLDTNRKGFIVLPTVVPVSDAEIDDNDVAFLKGQLDEQAIVVQAKRIAEREVSLIDPRRNGQGDQQRLAAERETFSFGMCVVITGNAYSAAIKIATDALLSKNYLALEVGTWAYWCELAKEEVRRISAQTRRKLAQSTVTSLFSRILNDLPPLINQLEKAPVVTPSGEVIDPQFVIANPGILSEIGPLVRGISNMINDGHAEMREKFDEAVLAYASMSQKEIRDWVRGLNQANVDNPPEKKRAQRHEYRVVDQASGKVSYQATYIVPAATDAERHWIETQLSARYEFEQVDVFAESAMASASA